MVSTFFLDFKQGRRGLPKGQVCQLDIVPGTPCPKREFGCDWQLVDAGLETTRDRFRVHPVDKKKTSVVRWDVWKMCSRSMASICQRRPCHYGAERYQDQAQKPFGLGELSRA
jgi:hypothetical protein